MHNKDVYSMKFSISVLRVVLLVLIFILFSLVVYANSLQEMSNEFLTKDWFVQNWELCLLALSEGLALLPGKHSGILKILVFFFSKAERRSSYKIECQIKIVKS